MALRNGSKFFDFDAAKGNLIAMILEKDMPTFRHSKVFVLGIFTSCNQRIVNGGSTLIFHYFVSVQPVFYAIIRMYHNACPVPFANLVLTAGILHGWYKIIQ